MPNPIPGLHHVTAIAGDPQRNLDFYTGVLGLRLIKLTVNFDSPGTYHFYYGDGAGNPGTILTFFPWPGTPRGRRGAGQATATAFAVPPGALDFWRERLARHGIPLLGTEQRFGEAVVAFEDPDGLLIELVATGATPADAPWTAAGVPAEAAIRGFHSSTLTVTDGAASARLLTETMGFWPAGAEAGRSRFLPALGAAGGVVDLVVDPAARHGGLAAGIVHHIAFRVADDPDEIAWQQQLLAAGLKVTPPMDRQYFHSIYFREPGGVLYELATDPPGFTVDELPAELGTGLKLPPRYESQRAAIERALPPLRLPHPEPAEATESAR